MTLLGSCMRFLTSLSRRPECWSCPFRGHSSLHTSGALVPVWSAQNTCRSCPERGVPKGQLDVAVSQQEQERHLDRASSPPACSRQGCSFSFHAALALVPAHFNLLWFSAISPPWWGKDFSDPKTSLMSEEVIWSPSVISREEWVFLATWPNIKSVFFRVLIFLLYLSSDQVVRPAPQSSKTTWAVCCSPGNALEGGLGSCSELKVQIRLLFVLLPFKSCSAGRNGPCEGGEIVFYV